MAKEVKENNKTNQEELNIQLLEMINKVDNLVKQQELRKYIVQEMFHTVAHGSFIIGYNMFNGEYDYKEKEISIKLEFMLNSLSLTVKINEKTLKILNYYNKGNEYETEYIVPTTKEVNIDGSVFDAEVYERLNRTYDNNNKLISSKPYTEYKERYIEPENQKVKSIG